MAVTDLIAAAYPTVASIDYKGLIALSLGALFAALVLRVSTRMFQELGCLASIKTESTSPFLRPGMPRSDAPPPRRPPPQGRPFHAPPAAARARR